MQFLCLHETYSTGHTLYTGGYINLQHFPGQVFHPQRAACHGKAVCSLTTAKLASLGGWSSPKLIVLLGISQAEGSH